MSIIVLAEAGVNHNGSLKRAFELVDIAAEAGADFVKFQSFKAEKLVSSVAKQADYQIKNTGEEVGQLKMLRQLELSLEDHIKINEYCKKRRIQFLSSAFDIESIDMLLELGLNIWKIPSGEITNLPYLQKIGNLGQQVILSTGMSTLKEVEDAINALVQSGTKKNLITVLHCNTEYPTPIKDVNLNAMLTIQKAFGVSVGYSDHTLGMEVSIAAVALGAKVIEKHFTLDKSLPGPDHKASLDPEELKLMISSIRNVEIALGDGNKTISPSELRNLNKARKSIHLAVDVKKGLNLQDDHIEMKRPGDGISPMEYQKVIGMTVTRDLKKDHQLKWEDLI